MNRYIEKMSNFAHKLHVINHKECRYVFFMKQIETL